MRLNLEGRPLHSRHLTIDLKRRGDGLLDARGELVDLRKCAFILVNGDIQPAGIVHHMQLAGVVDPATRVLTSLDAAQPTVAFEPSEIAQGESCRDPIGLVGRLAETRLDDGFSRTAAAELGGSRGCSHILTLTQLLGATVPHALDLEGAADGGPREDCQRIFRRDLSVDGSDVGDGIVQLALQLTDLHTAPTVGVVRPIERFAGGLEVRVLVTVEMKEMAIARIAAAERRRDREGPAAAAWIARDSDVAPLVGLRLAAGVGGELLRHFGARGADGPLLDTLLNLTPALHQCMAILKDEWIFSHEVTSTYIGMGGPTGSCYMWRQGGALDCLRNQPSSDV